MRYRSCQKVTSHWRGWRWMEKRTSWLKFSPVSGFIVCCWYVVWCFVNVSCMSQKPDFLVLLLISALDFQDIVYSFFLNSNIEADLQVLFLSSFFKAIGWYFFLTSIVLQTFSLTVGKKGMFKRKKNVWSWMTQTKFVWFLHTFKASYLEQIIFWRQQ